MNAINSSLGRLAPFAPTVLRITLGVLFLYHGIDKFDTGISNVEGFFASEDVPFAGFTAPLTAVLEIVGGLALIAGALSRITAAVMAGLIAGALIFVKLDGDVLGGSELDFAYLAGLVALMFLGAGRLSVDETVKLDQTVVNVIDLTTPSPIASRR